MSDNLPSRDEWLRLYELLSQVKALAPWEWMEETAIFVIQNPETGQFGYVSVMGALGEHTAVAVYLGTKGFYGFLNLLQAGPEISIEEFFMVPQLQASMEDREELKKKDRDLIKELGLKFRGRGAWPLFRSYRPACEPWYMEAGEARFLAWALEQLLEVAPRYRDDLDLVQATNEGRFLARIPQENEGELIWRDDISQVPPEEITEIPVMIEEQVFERLESIEQGVDALELDLLMMEYSVQDERGGRPYFPFLLLIVEPQSDMIVSSDLLSPLPSLEEMWSQVPILLTRCLVRLDALPLEIRVRSQLLESLLAPLTEMMGSKIKRQKKLRRLDRAQQELMRFLG